MKTKQELNIIAITKYGIEEGLWLDIGNDDEEFCQGEALSILLKEEIVWTNTGKKDLETNEYELLLFVNTNDVMMWACGDAELLTYNQVEPLIMLYLDNPSWGTFKWACLINNMQPQFPIKRDMITAEYWDDELGSLPLNAYDKPIKKDIDSN
ncbi:MAG: hypothetical protein DRG78_03745 [Epsilonproteobacteria bacterium]|nr:MAG: hypothetical protein DRG78_03745 [Campylobacterota bacterium]